ncbi:MAG: HAD-IB family phosphatase [Alphaproteobacteria bacterium]|nr:HAD-IB family phosphatase [Alphaproteobacteria bacterium]MCL2504886.1 HAD-IB family phosphatase [Alphaproteobacteria bacterium]
MADLAIYDFDHTLVTKDSLFLFLDAACGKPATYSVLVSALIRYVFLNKETKQEITFRTFMKKEIIKRLLVGRTLDDMTAAAAQVRRKQVIKKDMFDTLIDHLDKGDTILIASGSLSLYLPELLRDIPHDALICTSISTENNIVTGEMTSGNCVWKRKAELVKEWIDTQEKNGMFFDEIYAYGNPPDDEPLMELADYRTLIDK